MKSSRREARVAARVGLVDLPRVGRKRVADGVGAGAGSAGVTDGATAGVAATGATGPTGGAEALLPTVRDGGTS
ncbi:MAG: hypothetical protein JWN44_1832, partial [Myxococcales bacterium]|nr:hypothetical protein [Myxococcales bacterium]